MPTINKNQLFIASCLALLVTSLSFGIRAGLLNTWAHEFGLTQQQIGVITSTAYISGQYYGLGLLDANPFDKGKMYLSYNGSPSLLAEVLFIPYSAVIEA